MPDTTVERRIIKKAKTEAAGAFCAAICMILPGTFCLSARAAEEETPLRAAIFYHQQTWLQDFNIVHQIANEISENLEGHPQVALSCYGLESLSVTDGTDAAIRMKTDVLLIFGTNSEEALQAYQQLQEQGIRLILVDGDVEESGRYAYIGTDNYEAGKTAADDLAQMLQPGAQVAVLAPSLATTLRSVGARLDGFYEEAETAGLTVAASVSTTYDSLNAITAVERLLKEYPELDALFCADAVAGQAAADVVQEHGQNDSIMVVTFDWNEKIEGYLQTGALDVTYVQDTEAIGVACARALLALAQEETQETGEDCFFPCLKRTAQQAQTENGTEAGS